MNKELGYLKVRNLNTRLNSCIKIKLPKNYQCRVEIVPSPDDAKICPFHCEFTAFIITILNISVVSPELFIVFFITMKLFILIPSRNFSDQSKQLFLERNNIYMWKKFRTKYHCLTKIYNNVCYISFSSEVWMNLYI